MPKTVTLQLSPKQSADEKFYIPLAARHIGIRQSDIALARIVKRSIDARQRMPKVNLTLEIYVDTEPQPQPVHFDYPSVDGRTEIIVVGSGPAGLFAALRLIELGYRPIVLERGKSVLPRKHDIAQINRNGAIDPDSNYAFGEGGAGTFSDGKLFTRSKKRGDYNKALQTLVFHGANPEILFEAHPHIGTDKLPRIISNICRTITEAGGRILFNHKVSGFKIVGRRMTGVYVGDTLIEGAAVVLATGHSARDIYMSLYDSGVRVEAKPFAMGVRIEHPQTLIDSIQYHRAAQSVVNGMSPSGRNSAFANSGIVTEVREEDYAHLRGQWGELAGLVYQHQFEVLARENSGAKQVAPAQRVSDFVAGRRSASLPRTSYIPGLVSSRLDEWIPETLAMSLRSGIASFGRKMKGFVTDEAIVVGVESRTSTPVRIPRDPETLMHVEIDGLFPSGEGAGYAGGIVSAALDGEKVADAAVRYLSGLGR